MGSLFVVSAGILWGMMGLFVRSLSDAGLSVMEISFLRTGLSAVILFLLLLFYDRKLLLIKLKDLWCFFGTGVLSITFFGVCYFSSINITTLSVACVLLYTSPVFVMILSAVFFRESVTVKKTICIAGAILGCAMVTGIFKSSLSVPLKGILFGFGSAFGYALYSIFSRFAIKKGYGPLTIVFYSFLFSAIALLIFVRPSGIWGKIIDYGNMGMFSLYSAGLAVVVTVAPYVLYTMGLTKIENSRAAVLATSEPVAATILGILYFGEHCGIMEGGGIAAVLISMVLMNF